MRKYYYNNSYVSDSLIEFVKKSNLSLNDIDKDTIIEFISMGCIYSDKTIIKGLTKQVALQDFILSKENGFIKNISLLPFNPNLQQATSNKQQATSNKQQATNLS